MHHVGTLSTLVAVLLLTGLLLPGCAAPADPVEVIDFAHVDNGATVAAVSAGCNGAPYDVRAALGDGSHCSFSGALPNWYIVDLGQVRDIRAIEFDWRYSDKGVDDFDLSFGMSAEDLGRTIEVRGIGGQSKYWYRVLDRPIRARFVKFDVLALKGYQWTVINRMSLYGSTHIPRLVEQYGDYYSWLASRFGELTQQVTVAGAETVQPWTAAADEARTANSLISGTAPLTQEQWEAIERDWTILQAQAYRMAAAVSFAGARAASPNTSTIVGCVDNMKKVFREVWPAEASDGLELACARNEWESGQICVGALAGDIADIQVTWDRLKGPITLDNDAFDVQLVCYVKTEAAPYLTDHVGWWPDGLSPLALFDLPAGQVQPLWVTAKIPSNAPAGDYSTIVRISGKGMPQRSIPVNVKVWNFELPTESSLKNVFSLGQLLVEAWYRGDKLTWDDLKYKYYDFWLEHRINPTSLYGTKIPAPEDLDYCLERGMNAFILEYMYNGNVLEEEKFQALLDKLEAWDVVLNEKDLYDKAIVYLADEPTDKPSVTAEINRRAAIIGERFPNMQRMIVLTRPIDRAFDGNVDIWCPIVGKIDAADAKDAKSRGESPWWYTVGTFFMLDRPAAEARSMAWLSWENGLDGILYWTIQSGWRGDNKPSQFRPQPGEVMWENWHPAGHGGYNGIGNMTYPGPDGEPWSSIGLEVLRESMEDYEYLVLLKAALADRPADDYQQLLAVPTEFDIEYGVDETGNFITERRVAIGEALHSLSGQDSTK